MTAGNPFQFTLDKDREGRLFSNERALQDASDLEVLDDMAIRQVDAARRPADAQRALFLARCRVIAVFKDGDTEHRARAFEVVDLLNEATSRLNALADQIED